MFLIMLLPCFGGLWAWALALCYSDRSSPTMPIVASGGAELLELARDQAGAGVVT
jgi:hypothetical protein